VNRAALTSHARHTTQRGQCWVTRTSTSTGGRWRADARRAASPSGFRDAPRTSAAGDGDGGWTELLEEPLRKVLEELLSSVHLRTEGVGARPRRRCGCCAGWMSRHDALAMRLLLRQDATDEGAGVLVRRFPAVASLDLKCCCFNALTDEGMRAVSSLTVLTFLELWGCSKVTDERMRAVIK
jgi:hypothetical protein